MSRFDDGLLARALAYVQGQPATQPARSPRSALDIAADLCRQFEGYYAKPYLCPAGVPTVGYGLTRYPDGTLVRLTDPLMPREAAERLLVLHLEREVMPQVLALCPGVDDDNRLAALLDFTFNLGAGRLKTSTLRKRVNAGQWDQVPGELAKWVMGGGRVLPGLVRRRRAEAALI